MQEIEVEMLSTLANAISEAAELIADTYVVLYSNDFSISDIEDGMVATEEDTEDDAVAEEEDTTDEDETE